MNTFGKPLTVGGQQAKPAADPDPAIKPGPIVWVPNPPKRPVVQLMPRKQTPTRRHWTDFPEAYLERLQQTRYRVPITMGPMSWNDARFVQRDLRYFFRALACDDAAAELAALARRLRISCPRTDDDPNLHWVILKLNPLSL